MAKKYLTVRIDETAAEILAKLAEADQRTSSWMAEALILEALAARGLLPDTVRQRDSRSNPSSQQRP
jgi:predicted transcriptional regulator